MECQVLQVAGQRNKKWPQYLSALIVVVSMFTSGIHYGWPTPSLPRLLSNDHPLNMTSDEASYITTVASIGDIIGSIVFTIQADIIGRKMSMLLTAPLQITSMIMLYFSSHSIILLYIARFLGGLAEGGCLCVIVIYISEISEPRIRGTLLSFFSVAWYGGSLFVNIVGSYYSIETTSLITLVFPVVFLGAFIFMHETPYYLLMKNKSKESLLVLKKLRRNEDVEDEMVALTNDVKRQMSERGKYQDLVLIKSNRKALVMMVVLTAACEFSGVTSLTFYAQLLFVDATDVLSESLAATLMQSLQLLFTVVSMLIIDWTGRKPLLLFSIGGCCASLTLLSAYFLLDRYSSLEVTNQNWIPLVGMLVFQVFFSVGLGNVVNCLNGEVFSTSVKTKGLCVLSVVYAVCVATNVKLYQVLSDSFGSGAPILVFAVAQLLHWIFCWKCVPETRGKTLEEIQQEIKGHKNESRSLQRLHRSRY
jgi:MFS family permease